MNDVVPGAGVEERFFLERTGRAAVRALDREGVGAAAERDHQVLDRVVGDAGRHAEPGDRRRRQRAGVVGRVTAVIHIQPIAAAGRGVAVDRQQHVDGIHSAAADVERVRVFAAVSRRQPADRIDVDRIVAAVAVDRGRANVRVLDGEGVAGRAQADVQRGERVVGDTAGHVQTADRSTGQRADVDAAVAGVVYVEGIGPTLSVDSEAGTDSIQESGCSRSGIPDVDRIVAGPGVDDRFGAAGNVRDGDRVVVIAAIHGDVVGRDRAEQIDRVAGQVDVVVIGADRDVSACLDERVGLQREVIPCEQYDRAVRSRRNRDSGLEQERAEPTARRRRERRLRGVIGNVQFFDARIDRGIVERDIEVV